MEFVKNFIGNLNLNFSTNDSKAILVVVLIFFVLLLLAKMSRSYIEWYSTGWFIWLFLGFFLAVFIEGILLVGGKTIFTEVLRMQSAPRPIQNFIDSSRINLTRVLCKD